MSKGILVVDIPESCDMCDFTEMVNGKLYCCVPGCGELAEDYINCRPDWCPLHPMPEKQTHSSIDNTFQRGGKSRYNYCIDEILGGGVDAGSI